MALSDDVTERRLAEEALTRDAIGACSYGADYYTKHVDGIDCA